MSKPLVSVVITAYNRSSLLKVALESVLRQSFKNLEIIVIDDGSSDDTKDVVTRYAQNDPRIKYFYQTNKGIVAAKNAGVHKATGEFVAFLDSDDLWLPEKTQEQLKAFESDRAIGLVYTNADIIDNEGNSKQRFYIKDDEWGVSEKNILSRLLIRNFIPFSSIMIKKEILNKLGNFVEEFNTCEDYDWLLRLAQNVEFYYIDKPLTQYRISQSSVSHNLERRHRLTLKIINLYKARLPDTSAVYQLRLHKRFAQVYYGLGYAYYENNKLAEAQNAFWTAIAYWPFCNYKKYFLWVLCCFPVNIINQLRPQRVS